MFGSLDIEVLRVTNQNITANTFNNSSCVFRFTEKRPGAADFRWIVLGDLGVEGGSELLAMYPGQLKADAVQMAHHGQNGVDRPVYEAIAPRFAFWTTPDWLWTNTIDPANPGKGPWQTLVVREWLERKRPRRSHLTAPVRVRGNIRVMKDHRPGSGPGRIPGRKVRRSLCRNVRSAR